MQTSTQPAAQLRLPSRLIHRYSSCFAWAAQDDRVGRYVMLCPNKAEQPLGLGVVDDFGNLVPVPSCSTGFATAQPTTRLLA
jgi:hypothetical protein